MLKYLLILLLPLSLYSSKILSYNIYDRTDRVDVMLTFDTPYRGKIKQSKTAKKIIIKLENASIESAKIKKLSSAFLKSITIAPMQESTQIIAYVPSSNIRLLASKTADGYGLRLRFTTRSTTQKSAMGTLEPRTQPLQLPTKKDDELSQSYYIVIFILIVGIATLFYLRKKIPQTGGKKAPMQKEKTSNWLFQANQKEQKSTPTTADTKSTNEVTIRFQKPLDENNSVVMLDFGEQSYLILMGNGNILLDKFHENKPVSQQEFEMILQDRHQELESFLHGTPKASATDTKEALQSYKERAATLIYGEEN